MSSPETAGSAGQDRVTDSAAQQPRHTDPEHFGMHGYCPGPWPCALCDALSADKRTPYRGR